MTGSAARVRTLALAEARRSFAGFDRRTLALLLVLGAAAGVLGPAVFEAGVGFDRGLYVAAASPDAPLLPAMREASAFQVVVVDDPAALVDAGLADVAALPTQVYARDTDKGQAAVASLAKAAKAYAHRRYLEEPDQAAAFPVQVEVRYVAVQAGPPAPGAPAPPPPATPRPGGTTTAPVTGSGGAAPAAGEPARAGGLLPADVSATTPGSLAPPFPFRSLVLAYLFLVPMNFLVQVYGGSVIAERIGRRAEPVLASPARAWEIVAGKTLPHLALMLGVSVAVAVAIGAGWLSVLAVLPFALAFLALEFLAALVARSFRELTFLTVFISVALTVYAFLPAVFAQLSPVALVSPISLVVLDLRGEAVSAGQALYATLPLAGLALAVFALGAALYREEDLFHQKGLWAKLLDALAGQVRSWRSGFKVAVLLIPCVFVAELLLVVALVAVSGPLALAGGLVAVALIEETCKGLPSYAAVQRGALPRASVVRFGALAGLGFFVAEKGFLLAALVGLTDLPAGTAVFGGGGAALVPGLGAAPLLALLVAPLGLHVATATLSAWGARGGKALFAASFACAVVAHAAYNAVVLTATLEGLR